MTGIWILLNWCFIKNCDFLNIKKSHSLSTVSIILSNENRRRRRPSNQKACSLRARNAIQNIRNMKPYSVSIAAINCCVWIVVSKFVFFSIWKIFLNFKTFFFRFITTAPHRIDTSKFPNTSRIDESHSHTGVRKRCRNNWTHSDGIARNYLLRNVAVRSV
jgi:hypothetical protein